MKVPVMTQYGIWARGYVCEPRLRRRLLASMQRYGVDVSGVDEQWKFSYRYVPRYGNYTAFSAIKVSYPVLVEDNRE